MKKKLTIITICLIITLMLGICFSNISNAAIEIKPNAVTHQTWANNSGFDGTFSICYNLRSSTSTLGNNSLDPHLALNADIAAASYLALSPYGGNSYNYNSIVDESSTKNNTGTFIWGGWKNTSGYADRRLKYTITSAYELGTTQELPTKIQQYKDTKYVEKIDYSEETSKGRGFYEINGWFQYTNYNTTSTEAFIIRDRGIGFGRGGDSNIPTYCPVIWN